MKKIVFRQSLFDQGQEIYKIGKSYVVTSEDKGFYYTHQNEYGITKNHEGKMYMVVSTEKQQNMVAIVESN